ncbi:MAG: membrane protein YdbS with pleckstrin-like domain [Chlamydiales bacterium]|jgi:membrane protein YdbS with pleckstrin-like domain
MRCHQCSSENSVAARFCDGCGAPLAGAAPDVGGLEETTLVVRPTFVPRAALLSALPLQLFLTIWGGAFFGGFSQLVIDGFGLPIERWVPFPVFGALFFFGIALFFYKAQGRSYEQTEFRFTRFKLDYFEGFLTIEEKTIPLANVAEVSLRRGLVQKRHNLGTIVLKAPTPGVGAAAGIQLHDVENPEDVFEAVKGLVDHAHRGNEQPIVAAA